MVTEPIYQGDYTLQQFKWLTSSKTDVYFAQYTGAEIRQVMEWLVNVKENGVNPVRYNKPADYRRYDLYGQKSGARRI